MFIYENGLPVDYECDAEYSPEIDRQVREKMVVWFRGLPPQSRRRLGKVGQMQGSEVNLSRVENE